LCHFVQVNEEQVEKKKEKERMKHKGKFELFLIRIQANRGTRDLKTIKPKATKAKSSKQVVS